MDMNNMLEYRNILERKRDREFAMNGLCPSYRLAQRQCDVMDEVFGVVWMATMEEVVPNFRALTGKDFDSGSLKLALNEFNPQSMAEDTQVVITFVPETMEVEAAIPGVNDTQWTEEIRAMLSKNFSKNIEPAIKLYLQGTGKDILPADAWVEIKDMLPDNKVLPGWDIYIATQYRQFGPIAAFMAIKKWLPTWNDVEIGRLIEDTMKRMSADTVRNTPAAISALRMLMEVPPTKDMKDMWAANPTNIELIKNAFKLTDIASIKNVAKKVIAVSVPSIRRTIEKQQGTRIPYVEKGY